MVKIAKIMGIESPDAAPGRNDEPGGGEQIEAFAPVWHNLRGVNDTSGLQIREHTKYPGYKISNSPPADVTIFGYLAHFCVKDLPGNSIALQTSSALIMEMMEKTRPSKEIEDC